MRKIIFIFVFLFIISSLYANCLFRLDDNIYYASSFGKEEIKNNFNLSTKAFLEGAIVKFGKNLTIEKIVKLDNLSEVNFVDAFVDFNGNIIVVGYANEDSFGTGKLKNIKSKGHSDIILLKYDNNLKLIKAVNYGSVYDDAISKGILLKDGNILICGRRSISEDEYHGFVAKFNSDFKCIKEFEYSKISEFINIIETFDNSIIVCNYLEPLIITFDNNLKRKNKHFFYSKKYDIIINIIEKHNGYYALSYDSNNQNGFLLKLDKNFKEIDIKSFLPKYKDKNSSLNLFTNIEYYDKDKYFIIGEASFDKDISYYTLYNDKKGFENIRPIGDYSCFNSLLCNNNILYSIRYDDNFKIILEKNIIK